MTRGKPTEATQQLRDRAVQRTSVCACLCQSSVTIAGLSSPGQIDHASMSHHEFPSRVARGRVTRARGKAPLVPKAMSRPSGPDRAVRQTSVCADISGAQDVTQRNSLVRVFFIGTSAGGMGHAGTLWYVGLLRGWLSNSGSSCFLSTYFLHRGRVRHTLSEAARIFSTSTRVSEACTVFCPEPLMSHMVTR